MKHEEFLDKIKSKLNTQNLNDFPFIFVTAKDREIAGKMQDVFDEDLIILKDNGLIMVVEWNEITNLKLQQQD